jgi:hypothetical protein
MLKGSGLTATDPKSRAAIKRALAWTQRRLGVEVDMKIWTGPLYQNANRLATLMWLRDRGVDAWLVHLLFTGDTNSETTAKQWEDAVASADKTLGLDVVSVPWATHVTLAAGTYKELTTQ